MEGWTFEEALSKFFGVVCRLGHLTEGQFCSEFGIADRIVDFCLFFPNNQILLIQAKHRLFEKVTGVGKIMSRMENVKSELQKKLPNHKIMCLIVVAQKEGKIPERKIGWLVARNIWTLLLRLKNCLMKNGYLSEEDYGLCEEKFKELLVEYQIYERQLESAKRAEEERMESMRLLLEMEKLTLRFDRHRSEVDDFISRIETLD